MQADLRMVLVSKCIQPGIQRIAAGVGFTGTEEHQMAFSAGDRHVGQAFGLRHALMFIGAGGCVAASPVRIQGHPPAP